MNATGSKHTKQFVEKDPGKFVAKRFMERFAATKQITTAVLVIKEQRLSAALLQSFSVTCN